MALKELTPILGRELMAATKVVYTILENHRVGDTDEDGYDSLSELAGKLHTQLEHEGF